MVMKAIAALALACAGLAASAQQLQSAGSEVVFVSKQMGVAVEGRFKRFAAQLAFDPAKPELAKVSFTVDLASATLGVAEVDAELPKPAWFNVAKFPQATFAASKVTRTAAGAYRADGQLTIKGVSQPLAVPLTLVQSGTNGTASGQFAIKRLAFGIGGGEWGDTSLVADDVQVRFKLALTGLKAP